MGWGWDVVIRVMGEGGWGGRSFMFSYIRVFHFSCSYFSFVFVFVFLFVFFSSSFVLSLLACIYTKKHLPTVLSLGYYPPSEKSVDDILSNCKVE